MAKIHVLDGQLKKEAEQLFEEWERLGERLVDRGEGGKAPVAHIQELRAATASGRYIQLLDEYDTRLYLSPDLGGTELPATGDEQVHHAADWQSHSATLGTRRLRIGMFRRMSHEWSLPKLKNMLPALKLRLAADMVEIAEDAPKPADSVELAEAKKSLREIAALLNEIETQRAQLQYTGELRVGIGCVKPEAKLEIALSAKDADTKPLVIRKDNDNYLTVLKDGKVGIGTQSPQNQLHSSANQLNVVVASQSTYAGIAIAQGNGVNVTLRAEPARGSIGTASNHNLALETNNAPRVWILADGKVAIGHGVPRAQLSIAGGLHVVSGGLHLGGESDPGNKNLLVSGKASIEEGLHVGGKSYDSRTALGVRLATGDKNLLVDGKASIMGGRQIGDEADPFRQEILGSELVVNGTGFFFGNLDVSNQIRFRHDAKHFVAQIQTADFSPGSGNYALMFKTCHNHILRESLTVHPPGGDGAPTLTVAGPISERMHVIPAGSWTDPNNDKWSRTGSPIFTYFNTQLNGKPAGTTLRAIADHETNVYWEGWVDAKGRTHLAIRGEGGK
jgi:hypothetical protein